MLARIEVRVIWPAAGIVVALGLWQLLGLRLGPGQLPSPTSLWPGVVTNLTSVDILEFQGGGSKGLHPHLLYTIQQTFLGSAIGVTGGIMLGLLMGRFEIFRGLVEVPVEVLRTVPPLAAIPFLLIWFGPTKGAQLGVVIFYAAVMLTITTLTAVSNLDPSYRQYALTLGASGNHVFKTVVMPAILPEITGGIRVAVGVAWGLEVVSELMGAPLGMGQVFNKMVSFHALDIIIIGIFWVTVAAVAVDLVIIRTMGYVTRWSPTRV